MKILFVVDSFQGGAGNVIQILAAEFKKRGYECAIFLCNDMIAPPKYDLSGIEIIDYNLNKNAHTSNPVSRIIAQKNIIIQKIRETKPDAVISFLTANNTLCCMAKQKGIPLVISERIDPSKAGTKLHWRVLRWLEYGKANRVVVQCGNFVNMCGGKFKKITEVVANPILEPPFFHSVKERDTVTFISMGRLSKQKNFPWMIDRMCEIHKKIPNAVLHIYGSGPEKEYLQQYITDRGAQKFVFLMGYAEETYQLLSQADIYLMTSDFEGFPNALSEAMAVGLPSVSRECHAGIKDLVQDGVNGYLVGMDEKERFVERAIQLASNLEIRKKISEEAKKVSVTYGVSEIADQWERLIRHY